MNRPVTLHQLNHASAADFTAALGAIYEHSPWIPARAATARPFPTLAALQTTLAQTVAAASHAEQSALVAAHPDLAGRLACAGTLEPSSAAEQASLGLDRLPDAEFEQFTALNTAYRTRFGFPFVIAVRRHTRASVLAAFSQRLQNDPPTELRTALAEIDAIAAFRLHDLVQAA